MKKKNIFLAILGGLFALGIVMILVGIALGGRIYNLSIQPNSHTTEKSVSHDLTGVSLTDTKDIQSLNFKLSANEIEIRTGEEFSVRGGRLSKNKVDDGVWCVESKFSDHFYQIDIFGLSLPIPRGWHSNENDEEIIITLPRNVRLQDAKLNLTAADVDIDLLACDTLNLDLSAGDVTIESLLAGDINVSASAGNIDIEQYQITQSAKLDCSAGDIDFGKHSHAFQNFCSNLSADCSMGDIEINGKLMGENFIDCTMGNITLNLPGSQGNYNVNHTSQSLGDISFNEKNATSTNEIYGTLDLDCTLGDIDINYLGTN